MKTVDAITPFQVEIADTEIEDLRDRLKRTRWPEPELVDDWAQGIPLAYVKELCGYWADAYDMRRLAARLNAWPQFQSEIDGLDIHFIHVRSPHPEAMPMIMTHGWPGSVLEFLEVIGPLTDPVAHGGDAGDAFHLVCPTLPGFGFGGKPAQTGWGIDKTGEAWVELMRRLGYDRFVAQGGDWGAMVTAAMAEQQPVGLLGIHLNIAMFDLEAVEGPTAEELEDAQALTKHFREDSGYSAQQSTRPQTVGYGLADSPAAQCAWIVEKFMVWADCDGHPENIFSRDDLLDNVMAYWLPASGVSSARFYWESYGKTSTNVAEISTATAYSVFPHEVLVPSERLVRTRFKDLRYYNRLERGGHFAAMEVPDIFVEEVRKGIRALRVRDRP